MEINKELINTAIKPDFISLGELDECFVILLEGKLFTPKQGRILHGSYDEAWKHFYSQMHWRIKNMYKRKFAESRGYKDWWSCRDQVDKTDRQIWEEFKSEIIENYGFKIVRWKDAKRDVCS